MDFISWKDIEFKDGFWGLRQDVLANATADAIYNRFDETGRIRAMNLNWKEGDPCRPHVFWDSDVAKWMEGTAYLLYHRPDPELSDKLEKIIDAIEKGQTEDGYFNSAIMTLVPEKRFKDRTNHELYTAGHLMEAAVAHYEATGQEHFLKIMEHFADCIEKAFVTEKTASFKTPGHQEIELALLRMYHATNNPRYLELSAHFVRQRGLDPNDRVFSVPNGTPPAYPPCDNQLYYNDTYAQDDAPAHQLEKAGGHAVRAMYFYTAMAGVALETHDEDLFNACRRLWNDSTGRKMYVTGGVSAERYGEAIGTEYVLPLELSYAETCASVAMANFSKAMFCLEPDGKYMDMIELEMYNGALAGLSLDGKGFFYDNALMCRPRVTDFFKGIHATPLYPPYERQELFECSCCPPNIYRFIAAIGQYFYSTDGHRLFVHQYANSSASVAWGSGKITLEQKTEYPWDGDIAITLHGKQSFPGEIALRIPGWCSSADIRVNHQPVPYSMKNGYAYICRRWQDNDLIQLHLAMPVTKLFSNPNVTETAGKCALRRGPIIYCLEGIDQPEYDIFDMCLPDSYNDFSLTTMTIAGQKVTAIGGVAMVSDPEAFSGPLYTTSLPHRRPAPMRAVPYYCWANRGVNDMTVWIQHNG